MTRTIINIGTNKGNIVGASLDKKWSEITVGDIYRIVESHFGTKKVYVEGWVKIKEEK